MDGNGEKTWGVRFETGRNRIDGRERYLNWIDGRENYWMGAETEVRMWEMFLSLMKRS